MTMPIIISFYTEHTPYKQEAERLIESLRVLGLRHFIIAEPSKGSWIKNCAHKAIFIQRTLKELKEPVLWLDADATVEKYPVLFDTIEADFAAFRKRMVSGGRELLSGTLYFRPCDNVELLLASWILQCAKAPGLWDQRALALAWKEMPDKIKPKTLWLPQGYCKIFDRMWREEPKIEYILHHQASRRLRRKVR